MLLKIRQKHFFLGSLCLLLILACLFAPPAEAARRQARNAKPWWQSARYAGLVINADNGDVLYSANPDKQLHPASLTKMMTLYVVFSALDTGQWTKDTRLPVSARAAAASPTKLGLREGDTIRVEDAIKGLVTCSANDAAIVLAEGFAGSEDKFARIMTQTAAKLGMSKSQFYNASGLPNPGQYSSARDMATLALALQKHFPDYYPYFSTASFSYRGLTYNNHNHLMERYEGMDGIKTGYVNASGFNLVSSVRRNGVRLVGVVFGGSSASSRDQYMAKLLDAALIKATGSTETPIYAQGPASIAPEPQPANFATTDTVTDKVPVEAAQATYQAAAPKKFTARNKAPTQVAPATLAKKTEPKTSGWRIQVGAYKNKKEGQKALAKLQKQYPHLLSDSAPSLTSARTRKGHTVYRAQLVGLDQNEAQSACATLKKNGQSCLNIPPA